MSPYGAKVTPDAKKNADAIKSQMVAGDFVIFKGPMKDNKGGVAIAAGTSHVQTDYHARKHELSGRGRRRPDLMPCGRVS